VPPAIAPMLDFFAELLDSGVVVGGKARVAARVGKDELMLKYTLTSLVSQVVGAVTVAPPVGLNAGQRGLKAHLSWQNIPSPNRRYDNSRHDILR
jgi:hypothetical protein